MTLRWSLIIVVVAMLLTVGRMMAVFNCACTNEDEFVARPTEVALPSCATIEFPSEIDEPVPFDFQVKVTNDTEHRIIVPKNLSWSALMVSDRNGAEADYTEHWLVDVRAIRSEFFESLEPGDSTTLTYPEVPQIQSIDRNQTRHDGVVLNMLYYSRSLPAGLYSMVYDDAVKGDTVVVHNGRHELLRDVFPDCVCDVRLSARAVIVEVHGN